MCVCVDAVTCGWRSICSCVDGCCHLATLLRVLCRSSPKFICVRARVSVRTVFAHMRLLLCVHVLVASYRYGIRGGGVMQPLGLLIASLQHEGEMCENLSLE